MNTFESALLFETKHLKLSISKFMPESQNFLRDIRVRLEYLREQTFHQTTSEVWTY